MRMTAASLAPGPARVLVRTDVSYCSVIQRFDAIAGEPSSAAKFRARSVPSAENENQSAAVSLRSGGCAKKRSEKHTTELPSPHQLKCRLLLVKKKHTRSSRMPSSDWKR